MKTELKALCYICDTEYPESEGSYSAPAYDGEEGAYFVCNKCRAEADQDMPVMEEMNEDFQESYDEGDYPRD